MTGRRVAATELSLRELEVLALVAEGLTNHEIAARLNIAYDTARGHLYRISEKVGISNRVKLARYFLGLPA